MSDAGRRAQPQSMVPQAPGGLGINGVERTERAVKGAVGKGLTHQTTGLREAEAN